MIIVATRLFQSCADKDSKDWRSMVKHIETTFKTREQTMGRHSYYDDKLQNMN
jgi:hypothetical protein